jgi:antiviral helicase SLH1
MPHDVRVDDPQLGNKRESLVHGAATKLDMLQMIKYDQVTNSFFISDLGRIAAKYYLKHETVEILSE